MMEEKRRCREPFPKPRNSQRIWRHKCYRYTWDGVEQFNWLPRQPNTWTFGLLLHLSQLTHHLGVIVPEELLPPRCLPSKPQALKASLYTPVSHWVTARNPQFLLHFPDSKSSLCYRTCSYRKLFFVIYLFVCLFITAQPQLPQAGLPNTDGAAAAPLLLPGKHWLCTLDVASGFHLALGMLPGYLPVLCPVTVPTFPTLHFSHLVKTLPASHGITEYPARHEHRAGGEMIRENGPPKMSVF